MNEAIKKGQTVELKSGRKVVVIAITRHTKAGKSFVRVDTQKAGQVGDVLYYGFDSWPLADFQAAVK